MTMTNTKKKILFIVEAMGGGVFTYIVDLSNELCKKFDMYVAYATRDQTPTDYASYFDSTIHLIHVKNFTREISPKKDIAAFFEIQRIAKEINPDIIHLHSSKAGALGRFAFNGKDVPLFYTPHGYSFLMQNYGKVKRTAFHAVEVVCAKCKCTTIACSKGEYEETLKLTKRATYVNNGINIQKLANLVNTVKSSDEVVSENDDKNKSLTVFTLGRINYQKGPDLFNTVAETLPNVRFIWIGDGQLRDKLTSPNITITGWLDRKSALKIATSADVFILTSLWEGLPISLLESMYMKKLCVVSDVIGNHDVIHNGENGFVCKDSKDFLNAIKQSGNDATERLITNAYNDVISNYNTTVMAEKYSEIYEDALRLQGNLISNQGGVTSNLVFSNLSDLIAYDSVESLVEA